MDNIFPLPASVPTPSWREWLLWLLRRRLRLRVTGDSMRPTLAPGELVLVDNRAYTSSLPQPGDVVAAWHPHQSQLAIVKRVAFITAEGGVFLHSDNAAAGSDSRRFGAIAPQQVLGRVTCRIPREP